MYSLYFQITEMIFIWYIDRFMDKNNNDKIQTNQ